MRTKLLKDVATTLSKLEAEEKARKALEEDNKRQVGSIHAE